MTGVGPNGVAGADVEGSDVVLFDGRVVPAAKAVVPVVDRAVLYGESLFETLRVVAGAPCLWEEHVARLAAGCRELGLPLDVGALGSGVRALLSERPVAHGALRIQVTGGAQPGGGRGLTAPSAGRLPHVVATVTPLPPVAPDVFAHGVAVVSDSRWPRVLPHLKSGNYLASVAAKQRAEAAGAYECLLTAGDPPEVLEGATSNVLVWDGSTLVSTPPARRLAGVTLAAVVAVASVAGVPVREERVLLDAVRGNGLLLTGSLLGVCFCSSLDGHRLLPSGHLAGRLLEALHECEAVSRERWLVEGATAS